ncbi:hypothetical protein Q7P37_000382 [Cladosporium fusiforme]
MVPSLTLCWYALAVCVTLTNAADVSTDETPVGTLYAYGQNVSGLPLFYADGIALLGYGHPKDVSAAVNVTFFDDDSTTSLTSTPNNTAFEGNWTKPLLYIDTRKGSFREVGFTSSSNNSYTTTGFKFWGRQLLWTGTSEDGSVGRSFWAAPRGSDGVWSLYWNPDNEASEIAVPVVLKRQPPPALNDDEESGDQ